MSRFLQAKRGGALPAAIFFTLFFTLFSVAAGLFASVGVGNPLNKVTHSLLKSDTFKVDAGTYLVSELNKKAGSEEATLLTDKGPAIAAAFTGVLNNSVFEQQLDSVTDTVFAYYSQGSQGMQSVDLVPIVNMVVTGLEAVDPQFSALRDPLSTMKPIDLKPQSSGPNVKQVLSDFRILVLALFLLSLMTGVLYVYFAESFNGVLKTLSWIFSVEGVFLIALAVVGKSVATSQANQAAQSIVHEVVPIVSSTLLTPLKVLGVLELLIGLGMLAPSVIRRFQKTGSV
ncbi:MAG: hypothetical protein WCO64_07115 [Actinomycetes bacterium]